MKKILLFLSLIFAIFLNIDSTHAETVSGVNYPFSLTTTSLNADDTFQFKISAAGTFYVDCGVDGTLSGTGANGGTITKSDTTEYTYTCTYSSGTAKTIQFGGTATGYRTDDTAAIKFNIDGSVSDTNAAKISSISGSLGQIFGTIANPATGLGQPKFFQTFYYATNMTGTNTPDPNNTGMNYALPSTLFDGISGTPIRHLFSGTFQGCRGLTGSIPSGLFGNLSGAPAPHMFATTFDSCHNLTGSIPSGLFGNISGAPAPYMFYATFWVCGSLTGSIPSNLFGNLSGAPASYMFAYTFRGCSGLTGFGDKTYVPGDFLANVNTNTSVSNQATSMFSHTQLAATCPAGTYASTREQFNNASKPWCTPNTISMTFDGTTTMSCDYGGTFIPPAPAPRRGYVFTGWKLNTPQSN